MICSSCFLKINPNIFYIFRNDSLIRNKFCQGWQKIGVKNGKFYYQNTGSFILLPFQKYEISTILCSDCYLIKDIIQ